MPPSQIMLLSSIFTFCAVVIALPTSSTGLSGKRAERAAEKQICSDMAEEVVRGAASRFAYMATRCPARFLTGAEETAQAKLQKTEAE